MINVSTPRRVVDHGEHPAALRRPRAHLDVDRRRPGQLVRFRNQVREHPSGSIGVTPVDGGDIRIITAWLQDIQRKGLSLDDSDQAAPVENGSIHTRRSAIGNPVVRPAGHGGDSWIRRLSARRSISSVTDPDGERAS